MIGGLSAERHGHRSGTPDERSSDGGSARARDTVADTLPEQIAFGAAGSSGLRREDAACRRMTIAGVLRTSLTPSAHGARSNSEMRWRSGGFHA
jgi:hypothetical protein